MPKYAVYGIFTATKYIGEFEADSPEDAERMAEESEENYASLCHQCTNEVELDDICASRFIVEER